MTPSSSRRHSLGRRTSFILAIAVTLGLAACSSDDGETDGSADTVVTDISLEEVDDAGDTSTAVDKPSVEVPDELPTELVVTDLIDGQGHAAEIGDTVFVDYVGVRAEDGVEFDNSYDRGVPFELTLGQRQVIQGWETGLVGARAGGRRQLDIPAELAYGDAGAGEVIRPGDALSFVVDIRAVVPAVTIDDAPAGIELSPVDGNETVITTDVTVGDGASVELGDTAIVHLQVHRGAELQRVYDTWSVNQPNPIPLIEGQTLQGLVDGLRGMRVGGIRILSIPSSLAFGNSGNQELGIAPDDDLVIIAELVGRY